MPTSLHQLLTPSKKIVPAILLCALLTASSTASSQTGTITGRPIKVAVVGLVHDHIAGFLPQLSHHADVQLVGVVETNPALIARYERDFHLDPHLVFPQLENMISQQHPDALLVYTSTADHRRVIETAARHGISVMVEKPLSTSLADAIAISQIAKQHHIQVLVNYETTWYASNAAAYKEVQQGSLGSLRRVVIHDGHRGPKEIGVGPEFLKWLTDPKQNGAGALFDFGCYGADLMTWLMGGEPPLSVTAVTQTDKPELYPNVDDEATVILKYPKAQAVIQASWNWAYDRKDMEVYGATGYAITVGPDRLKLRLAGQAREDESVATPLSPLIDNSLDYLVSVLRGQTNPDGSLTGLDTNLVAMQILDAARESARTGKTIQITPLHD